MYWTCLHHCLHEWWCHWLHLIYHLVHAIPYHPLPLTLSAPSHYTDYWIHSLT